MSVLGIPGACPTLNESKLGDFRIHALTAGQLLLLRYNVAALGCLQTGRSSGQVVSEF